IGTRVTRAGLPPSTQGAPFLPGPTFAGPYHAAGDPASAPLTYGRFHNPTWTYYEQALSELEGGPAVTFASGMAAVAAACWGRAPPRRCGGVTIRQLLHHAGNRQWIFHPHGRPGAPGADCRQCPATVSHRGQAALVRVPEQSRPRRLRYCGPGDCRA